MSFLHLISFSMPYTLLISLAITLLQETSHNQALTQCVRAALKCSPPYSPADCSTLGSSQDHQAAPPSHAAAPATNKDITALCFVNPSPSSHNTHRTPP